LTDTTRNRNS